MLLLLVITAWYLHRRKKYKPSSHRNQRDGDMNNDNVQPPVPGTPSANLDYPMRTWVSSTVRTDPPIPAVLEEPASDPHQSLHVYQDAEEVRRCGAKIPLMSEHPYPVDSGGHCGAYRPPVTLDPEPGRGVEEYKYHNVVPSGFGRGTVAKQVRLFDPTVYNTLDSARDPVVGHSAMISQKIKWAENTSCTWDADIEGEETSLKFHPQRGPVGTLDWNTIDGESDYDITGAASVVYDGRKLPMVTTAYPIPDNNTAEEESLRKPTMSPLRTNHQPLGNLGELFYYQLDSSEAADITISQAPRSPSAFDSDDYSLLNPRPGFLLCYPGLESHARGDHKYNDKDTAVNSNLIESSSEALYAKVDKQNKRRLNEKELVVSHQGTTNVTNGATANWPVEQLYATIDKRGRKC
ncbi:uncharacterized protein [Diadema setosum]|uniref:uncharacterized protein n=1 Tax=Diadema setosum TaxID=31175 RepID=UPI003B3A49B4